MMVCCVCLFTPALAMAQWGGSSYYSDYSYYSEDYSSGGDCGCGDSGWLSYIPYIGGCNNKIEIDDKFKIPDPAVLAAR